MIELARDRNVKHVGGAGLQLVEGHQQKRTFVNDDSQEEHNFIIVTEQ